MYNKIRLTTTTSFQVTTASSMEGEGGIIKEEQERLLKLRVTDKTKDIQGFKKSFNKRYDKSAKVVEPRRLSMSRKEALAVAMTVNMNPLGKYLFDESKISGQVSPQILGIFQQKGEIRKGLFRQDPLTDEWKRKSIMAYGTLLRTYKEQGKVLKKERSKSAARLEEMRMWRQKFAKRKLKYEELWESTKVRRELEKEALNTAEMENQMKDEKIRVLLEKLVNNQQQLDLEEMFKDIEEQLEQNDIRI